MQTRNFGILLIIIGFLFGLQTKYVLSQSQHPKKQNYPGGDNINVYSNHTDTLANHQKYFPTDLKTYKISSSKEHIIGKIEEVLIENEVLILDSDFNEVKRYSLHGNYKGSFGRGGQGPGELAVPRDFTTDMNNRVWIIESDRSVAVFRRSPEDKFTNTDNFTVQYSPQTITHCNGHIYIYGLPTSIDAQPLHEYDMEGNHVESFGDTYKTDFMPLKTMMTESADMTCLNDKYIAIEYRYLPYTLVYNIQSQSMSWGVLYEDLNHVTSTIERKGKYGPEAVTRANSDRTTFGYDMTIDSGNIIVSKQTSFRNGKNKYKIYILKPENKSINGPYVYNMSLSKLKGDNIVYTTNYPRPLIKITNLQ